MGPAADEEAATRVLAWLPHHHYHHHHRAGRVRDQWKGSTQEGAFREGPPEGMRLSAWR